MISQSMFLFLFVFFFKRGHGFKRKQEGYMKGFEERKWKSEKMWL